MATPRAGGGGIVASVGVGGAADRPEAGAVSLDVGVAARGEVLDEGVVGRDLGGGGVALGGGEEQQPELLAGGQASGLEAPVRGDKSLRERWRAERARGNGDEQRRGEAAEPPVGPRAPRRVMTRTPGSVPPGIAATARPSRESRSHVGPVPAPAVRVRSVKTPASGRNDPEPARLATIAGLNSTRTRSPLLPRRASNPSPSLSLAVSAHGEAGGKPGRRCNSSICRSGPRRARCRRGSGGGPSSAGRAQRGGGRASR